MSLIDEIRIAQRNAGEAAVIANLERRGLVTKPDVESSLPEPPPQIDFPQIGLGLHRTTGGLVVLLLHTEAIAQRAGILAWAARDLGIPLDEFVREYNEAGN